MYEGENKMKHYAVILCNANHVDEFAKSSKDVFANIRNALRSFKRGKVVTTTADVRGMKSNIQVHTAEPIQTSSLLLVKNGNMTNVLDTTGLLTTDEQVGKLDELKTVALLLTAAEEQLLLSVAQDIYNGLPMDANSHRDVVSEEAIARINKAISENVVINRSSAPKHYGERVYKYITRNPEALREQIFTGVI
jgi:hypothetical protein